MLLTVHLPPPPPPPPLPPPPPPPPIWMQAHDGARAGLRAAETRQRISVSAAIALVVAALGVVGAPLLAWALLARRTAGGTRHIFFLSTLMRLWPASPVMLVGFTCGPLAFAYLATRRARGASRGRLTRAHGTTLALALAAVSAANVALATAGRFDTVHVASGVAAFALVTLYTLLDGVLSALEPHPRRPLWAAHAQHFSLTLLALTVLALASFARTLFGALDAVVAGADADDLADLPFYTIALTQYALLALACAHFGAHAPILLLVLQPPPPPPPPPPAQAPPAVAVARKWVQECTPRSASYFEV